MNRTVWHKRIAALMTGIMVMALFAVSGGRLQADDELMKWKKLDTMDTNFTVVQNKAGDDDILLELDMEDAGTYDLVYNLEDGYQTRIQMVNAFDNLNIEYHIYQSDGAGGSTDVTQARVSESYLEINYDLAVPDWEFDADKLVGASGGLEYTIGKSASSEYPGVTFEVDNKQVIIKWDFAEDRVYMLIMDYQYGSIMPITYSTPNKGTESFKVLKQLEDFTVTPTHYITTDGAFNIELSPVSMPNDDNERPGSRPGLDISFQQPKELNPTTWVYDYSDVDMDDVSAIIELDDIGSDSYLDFSFPLKDDPDDTIKNINTEGTVNDNVVYLYDAATHTYTVHIVKDKSDLAQQDTFIQWDELEASSIYGVNIGFEVELISNTFDDYEFTNYLPENDFGYTYLAYELQRSSAEEAFLDVTPYNAGDQDEVAYTVLYSKTVKETLDIDEDLWLQAYHSGEEGNDDIFIPVPFRSTSSQDAYQIVVDFSGVEIYTQVLNYRAVDDDDVPLTTPNVELIDNLFVVPSLDDADAELPERVKFDLVWTAPVNDEIKELDTIFENLDGDDSNDWIKYEISVNDLPTNDASNPFEVVKVFEVQKNGDGDYILVLDPAVSGTAIGSNTVNFDDGYNETGDEFRADDIILRENDLWTNVYEVAFDDVADTYTITDTGEEADITFPGINYLRVKAISMKDGELATSDMSVPVSLTLSMQTYVLPAVDTLDYSPLYGNEEDGTAGATLEWRSVDAGPFESYMLSPIGKTIEDMWYTVYIAEKKSSVLPLNDDDSDYLEVAMDNDFLVTVGDTDESELTFLRDGGVIYFNLPVDKNQTTDYAVDVQGLDINREYYVRIVTKVTVNDDPDLGNETTQVWSEPSDAMGITIPKTPDEPTDREVFPLAPEEFSVSFADESKSNALLKWLMPTEMFFEENANGFEVISIVDRSLPEELNSNGLLMTEVLEDEVFDDDVVEGWRIYVLDDETHLEKYNRDTDAYEEVSLDYLGVGNYAFSLIDDDNSPNKVNYYYVRTVKMTGTAVDSASAWVSGALTTAPVQGPINLVVDYTTEYDYEPQEEIVIRFDAPISDLDMIGEDYIVEIHVKGQDDADYSMTAYETEYLGSEGDVVVGFERLSYIIEGLTPGKEYRIKVRIEDRTQDVEVLPDGSEQYPRSAFTETVITRTDFDQESYDKENKYFEYIDYYLTQADKLKYIEYFRVAESSDETTVKYRQNYTTGLIYLNSGDEVLLYSEDKPINTYYIPSGTVKEVNENDVTVVIESLGHLVGIRSRSIGETYTDEIDEMLESIERYTSNDEDYYIRVRVYSDTYNGKINNSNPSSELVELELAVVGSNVTEEVMDERMVDLLDAVIEANKGEVIAAIEEDLEKGIDDDSLLAIVNEVLEEVETEYVVQASILFRGLLSDSVTAIESLNEPVYVALTSEESGTTHDVYTKDAGGWGFTTSSYQNGRYFVDNADLQPYVTVEKGTSNLAALYGQASVDVINRYDLTTIYSDYDLSQPNELLDKYQWINSVARLLDARAGEDTVDYLMNKGIDAEDKDMFRPLQMDEALYIYAQAFAGRHGFDLERVYISNYLMVKDISSVDEAYRDTLLQAANLDILPLSQGYMYPEESLDMDQALELLTTLYEGLK